MDYEYLEPYQTHILSQPHTLICGTTGSGKSYLLHKLLDNTHKESVCKNSQFIYIDLKACELDQYKNEHHTLCYCDNIKEVNYRFKQIIGIMEERYRKIKDDPSLKDRYSNIYVVIDEYMDIKIFSKDTLPLIQLILAKGRAARIHIILCTQIPQRSVLTCELKANFTCFIGLRCQSAIESRLVIGQKGCEDLGLYGQGYLKDSELIRPVLFNV